MRLSRPLTNLGRRVDRLIHILHSKSSGLMSREDAKLVHLDSPFDLNPGLGPPARSRSPVAPICSNARVCTANTGASMSPDGHSKMDVQALTSDSNFPSLVSAAWVISNMERVKPKFLDATWYVQKEEDPVNQFCAERIPGAQFFDLDRIADTSVDLPHMLPQEDQFAAAADALGISNDDFVVVYDRQGIFSAPRAWWTWRVFGHTKVAVLDGGLKAWKDAGGPVDTQTLERESALAPGQAVDSLRGDERRYKTSLRRGEVRTWQEILKNIEKKEEIVMDARPAARWRGEAGEPRPGLRSGAIPNSVNIPWNDCLHNGRLKTKEELAQLFAAAGVDLSQNPKLVASCGSGTTACILALAAFQVDPSTKPVAIYDGSWSEWGAREDLPIAQGHSK